MHTDKDTSTLEPLTLPSGKKIATKNAEGFQRPHFFDGEKWKPFEELTCAEVEEIGEASKADPKNQELNTAYFFALFATSTPEARRRVLAILHGEEELPA